MCAHVVAAAVTSAAVVSRCFCIFYRAIRPLSAVRQRVPTNVRFRRRRRHDPRADRRRPLVAVVAAVVVVDDVVFRVTARRRRRAAARSAAAGGDPRGRHHARRHRVRHRAVQSHARAGHRRPRRVRQGHTPAHGRHVQVHPEGRQVRGHSGHALRFRAERQRPRRPVPGAHLRLRRRSVSAQLKCPGDCTVFYPLFFFLNALASCPPRRG